MSDNWRNKYKTWAERLEYFAKNVEEGDVVFVVGAEEEKKEIRSFKLLLRVASPVFERMFSTEWSTESKQILLPDIQPDVFTLFLELLLRDGVDSSSITALEIPMEQVWSLLYVAKKYDVTSIHTACVHYVRANTSITNALNVWESAQCLDEQLTSTLWDFFESNMPAIFKEQHGNFSKETLIQILKSEKIYVPEINVFKLARRWARFQCQVSGQEKTGENIRGALGDALYLIRFPQLSAHDFVNMVQPKGILTAEESFSVVQWILSTTKNRESLKMEDFPFTHTPRIAQKGQICQHQGLGKLLKINADRPRAFYSCRGKPKIDVDLCSPRDIKMYSVGFFGPTLEDSVFSIKIDLDDERIYDEEVYAFKDKVFYAEFNTPILIPACPTARQTPKSPYPRVSIYIQGADVPQSSKNVTHDGITFHYNYSLPGPIAEWRYDEVNVKCD